VHNVNRSERSKKQVMTENQIATKILDAAFPLHTLLGPGLLESVYEQTLAYELNEIGLKVLTQVPEPLVYKEIKFEAGFRLDLLVENKVIVEIKSIENLAPVHFAQTLTYLRLADKKLGLLINFNSKYLKDGIHRIVNNL
jgi:GxxExxY protein